MKEHEIQRIAVAPDSETAQLIKEAAAGATIVVDTGDGLYEVQVRQRVPATTETAVVPGSETPMAFYAQVSARPDVRAILRRLARA